MTFKEKSINRRKNVQSQYENIKNSSIPNLEIKRTTKIHDRTYKKSNFTLHRERKRITEKGHQITIAVFIVSLIYSLGFLIKYSQTTRFQSIILSLIISWIFTRFIGLLLVRYFVSQSQHKRQKEFNE